MNDLKLDPSPSADEEAQSTFASPDDQRHLAETQTIRESNLDLRMNLKLRWKYARWVFCYLVSYSSFVALLLVSSGFNVYGFSLSESVLRVRTHSQYMTSAASAMAERKTFGHRSYRVATRRQSFSLPNMISIRLWRL